MTTVRQASIKFSFYSLTYAPITNALVQAAHRGVSVQALTNSHSDKYVAWKSLARKLGSDTSADRLRDHVLAGLHHASQRPGGRGTDCLVLG